MSSRLSGESTPPEMEWDELRAGGEISATVLMASGFVLQAGQRVRERYRVARVLGRGAMGQVLAVSLVGGADRQSYALKVVARPVALEGDEQSATLQEAARQAEAFAELLRAEAAKQDVVQRHGVAVARLFALVQLDDGSIGLRMELARGRSLEARIDRERPRAGHAPDAASAIAVVRKLLSQLRRLHEIDEPDTPRGLVHSDIKPGNVFVDEGDRSDVHVTLLDFGVATAGQALAADLAARREGRPTFVLKQTGGTLGYTPPGHFEGKATPLSDVYAALVILYELIALDLPWDFAGIDLAPEHIALLETAMALGPRPLRAVREAAPEGLAVVLDAFFVREFGALQRLAGEIATTRDAADDVQRALAARLSRLAREYQGHLEDLALRVPRRAESADASPPCELQPSPVPVDTSEGSDDRPTVRHGAGRGSGAGTIEIEPEPERPEGISASSSSAAVGFAPRSRVDRGRWWLRGGVGLALAGGAICVGLALRSRVPLEGPSARRIPAASALDPTALDAMAYGPAATAASPAGVVFDPDPHAGFDAGSRARTAVALSSVSSSPLEHAPPRSTTASTRASVDGGETVLANGAQRCTCLSNVRGARVVASGGALAREVELCVADAPAGDGRAEYVGSGVIPAAVFSALPSVACRTASETLSLELRRYAVPRGVASLFRCARAGVAAVLVESRDAAANASREGAPTSAVGPASDVPAVAIATERAPQHASPGAPAAEPAVTEDPGAGGPVGRTSVSVPPAQSSTASTTAAPPTPPAPPTLAEPDAAEVPRSTTTSPATDGAAAPRGANPPERDGASAGPPTPVVAAPRPDSDARGAP